MGPEVIIGLALCALASLIGTGLVRRYALARSVLDIPNERSSHAVPTPRGGGLAVAVALLAAIGIAGIVGYVEARLATALFLGGTLVAGIGWIDDHSHVPARWRALVHLAAASLALWCLGGLGSIRIGEAAIGLGLAGSILALVGIVWLVNLYNFMDGIDGIAGGEAVLVGSIGALLSFLVGASSIALCSALVAAAAAGFLIWNWPPAKIFMGDVGRSLLGFVFGVIAVASEVGGGPPLLAWVILLGVFVFDSTATLIRRVMAGEQWYSAHRSHAYQRGVQAGWSHRRMTSMVLALTAVLGALAAVGTWRSSLLPGTFGAGVILLVAAYLSVERARPMFLESGSRAAEAG